MDDKGVANTRSVHVQQHTYLMHKFNSINVNEAFATYDRLQQVLEEQILSPKCENLEKVNSTPPKSPRPTNVLMEGLISKASTPLFEGFSTSILSVIFLLLNLKTMHSMSNTSWMNFFCCYTKSCFQKETRCQKSSYEANKFIKSLGLSND